MTLPSSNPRAKVARLQCHRMVAYADPDASLRIYERRLRAEAVVLGGKDQRIKQATEQFHLDPAISSAFHIIAISWLCPGHIFLTA
jgi:hypothetical protein